MKKIKEVLINKCHLYVEERMNTVNQIISSNQKALLSETKSSAGDKHETGRAILQLEMEKASLQLPSITKMMEVLQKINSQSGYDTIRLGSIIITSQRNYFLAISIGVIRVNNQNYMVVSPSAPMGKLLLGKKKGDTFNFNESKITVLEIH